jgi:hypothetical protein
VAAAHQAADHIRAHSAQTDHSELHRCSCGYFQRKEMRRGVRWRTIRRRRVTFVLHLGRCRLIMNELSKKTRATVSRRRDRGPIKACSLAAD